MFVDTDNKRTIRERWNLPFLAHSAHRLGRTLAYFGLPGGALNDLIDWGSVLGIKTCVQIVRKPKRQKEEDLEIVSQMSSNLLVRDIRNAQIIRGAVEEVIIHGRGSDGLSPKLSVETDATVLFRYDTYNLDFLGGVGYRQSAQEMTLGHKSIRIKALEQLFARQRGHNFNLLLTLNVRDTFGDEPVEFLRETAQRSNATLLTEVATWGSNLGPGFKQHQLRLWVPMWIRELAEMQNFRCRCLPSVSYTGHENAKMIHFAFDFVFVTGRDLRVHSSQSAEDVLNLPMLTVTGGEFYCSVDASSPCTINDPISGPISQEELITLLAFPDPDPPDTPGA